MKTCQWCSVIESTVLRDCDQAQVCIRVLVSTSFSPTWFRQISIARWLAAHSQINIATKLKSFAIPVPRSPNSSGSSASWTKRLRASPPPKPTPKRTSKTPAPSSKATCNPSFTQRGKGWVETTLEKVLATQPQNGWSPPAANHSESGTPVLTLSAVTGFQFRPEKLKFTSARTDPGRNYWVRNGDFLITRSNTPELVGHVGIASGIQRPTIYPDLIMRMNPIPERIMTEFLYYQMRTPALRKEIMGRAQGANPTMKKISNGAVKTLPVAVPPIGAQREIVETLNAVAKDTQRLASVYVRKLASLEALNKSLLHNAFTGQL